MKRTDLLLMESIRDAIMEDACRITQNSDKEKYKEPQKETVLRRTHLCVDPVSVAYTYIPGSYPDRKIPEFVPIHPDAIVEVWSKLSTSIDLENELGEPSGALQTPQERSKAFQDLLISAIKECMKMEYTPDILGKEYIFLEMAVMILSLATRETPIPLSDLRYSWVPALVGAISSFLVEVMLKIGDYEPHENVGPNTVLPNHSVAFLGAMFEMFRCNNMETSGSYYTQSKHLSRYEHKTFAYNKHHIMGHYKNLSSKSMDKIKRFMVTVADVFLDYYLFAKMRMIYDDSTDDGEKAPPRLEIESCGEYAAMVTCLKDKINWDPTEMAYLCELVQYIQHCVQSFVYFIVHPSRAKITKWETVGYSKYLCSFECQMISAVNDASRHLYETPKGRYLWGSCCDTPPMVFYCKELGKKDPLADYWES